MLPSNDDEIKGLAPPSDVTRELHHDASDESQVVQGT